MRKLVALVVVASTVALGVHLAPAPVDSGLDQFKTVAAAGMVNLGVVVHLGPQAGFWDWVRVVASAVTVFITVWCMESRWGCD